VQEHLWPTVKTAHPWPGNDLHSSEELCSGFWRQEGIWSWGYVSSYGNRQSGIFRRVYIPCPFERKPEASGMLRSLQLPLSASKCLPVPREGPRAHLYRLGWEQAECISQAWETKKRHTGVGTGTEDKSRWTFLPEDSLSAQLTGGTGQWAMGYGLAPTQYSEPMSSMWSHDQEGHLLIRPQSKTFLLVWSLFLVCQTPHTNHSQYSWFRVAHPRISSSLSNTLLYLQQTQTFTRKYRITSEVWRREDEEQEGETASIPAPSIDVRPARGIACVC